ncbi:NAD-dependent succinate-semialdehyde dehydrogenase [Mesorhizobium sp. BR1-1-3]|jgi:succinate-semialdehyde dehydrogenase/glutarate-semialdehyde dehydrogenase|uniref:NAD-dependent succinate-semialdehyde dehydrogenase n=1 Tax=unclassified Mesorhizobium TaxID=325217 RepID=UPI000F753B45|nr:MULTISPECIES: NAD-dependent succinate-semialdehyde dehydrogenase [unclassified Mesorhizobium]RWE29420.1 MAG: aldehyde dehydrogenase family protein [Mesorhizobium sp.]AZO45222.1 NAD-dependent succinate-semialdehyde dehydrogenase [Mesorhizobium sp. M7D.F.Ca.US.005.01.1.1]MBZ9887648.1 NAD-dependent succinate-semialdehyde dehydrogenase [Mesorhizobium sp. BR1-1-3]TGP87978.1 NAD-dependent succinate-semialdehyde dehydrogenase [Mesorhizobium sp. M8A.F.Ca.ET.218.01.1.1]TGT15776.1 NAD-dependent succi
MTNNPQRTVSAVQSYPDLRLLIGGEWHERGDRESIPVFNPATEAVLGNLPVATQDDMDAALAAAATGFELWRRRSPLDRSDIIRRAAAIVRERGESIARLITLEEGKPLAEARIEAEAAAQTLEWFAEEGRRAYGRIIPSRIEGMQQFVVKEPVGPVLAIAPWNFPAVNPARKLGAALAAGCSCILKPPEEAPASAMSIVQALDDAGIPKGVISMLFGIPAEISSYLIASPIIRKVSFTGSVPVGKHLMALCAAGMKRTTMELGGHGSVIVDRDVDIDAVVRLSAMAKYRNAGQVCVSPTRFYVHKAIYVEFVERFAAIADGVVVGDGFLEDTAMGPLAHSRRGSALDELVADAEKHGANLRAGGHRRNSPGYFFSPTVLCDVSEHARVMNEEPFGPVALINPIDSIESGIKQANRLPYGLASYGFGATADAAKAFSSGLETGMVGINSFTISFPETPFLGIKDSGHGAENGVEGLETCLVSKFVSQI